MDLGFDVLLPAKRDTALPFVVLYATPVDEEFPALYDLLSALAQPKFGRSRIQFAVRWKPDTLTAEEPRPIPLFSAKLDVKEGSIPAVESGDLSGELFAVCSDRIMADSLLLLQSSGFAPLLTSSSRTTLSRPSSRSPPTSPSSPLSSLPSSPPSLTTSLPLFKPTPSSPPSPSTVFPSLSTRLSLSRSFVTSAPSAPPSPNFRVFTRTSRTVTLAKHSWPRV